jgi:hypothetical protein
MVESAEGVFDALGPLEIEGLAGERFAEVCCSRRRCRVSP